jgi:hypothetical protein
MHQHVQRRSSNHGIFSQSFSPPTLINIIHRAEVVSLKDLGDHVGPDEYAALSAITFGNVDRVALFETQLVPDEAQVAALREIKFHGVDLKGNRRSVTALPVSAGDRETHISLITGVRSSSGAQEDYCINSSTFELFQIIGDEFIPASHSGQQTVEVHITHLCPTRKPKGPIEYSIGRLRTWVHPQFING